MNSRDDQIGRDAARHARLAFRVGEALGALGSDIVVVPDVEANKLIPPDRFTPSDFVVQYLELRLRLILLVDANLSSVLWTDDSLRSAKLVLDHWPETSAVGLVADDEELTCLVVEPEDVAGGVGVPSGELLSPRAPLDPLPLTDSLQRYIESNIPTWNQIPTDLNTGTADTPSIASEAAAFAVNVVRGKRAQIPLRTAARNDLSSSDQAWAMTLIKSVLAKKLAPADVESGINQHLENLK